MRGWDESDARAAPDVLLDVLGFKLVDALVFVLVDALGLVLIDALVVVLVQVLGYVLVEAFVCVSLSNNCLSM